MKYTKNCPKCGKIQSYSKKGNLSQSIKNNTLCKDCSRKIKQKRHQWKLQGPFEKECPLCGKIMSYSIYGSLTLSLKHNSKCRGCCSKQQTLYTPEERKRKRIENDKKSHAKPEVKANIKRHAKEYYQRPEIKERKKKWRKKYNQRAEVKEKNKQRGKKYRQAPGYQEKMKKYKKDYFQKTEVKERYRQNHVKRRKNPIIKLNDSLSTSIRQSLKSNNLSKNGRHWENLVGYTVQELKEHLENLFQPGMTWENKGRNGWHIDHIIPIDFFRYGSTDDVEFKYCWSLNNLQPLWEEENIKKSNKLLKKYYSSNS